MPIFDFFKSSKRTPTPKHSKSVIHCPYCMAEIKADEILFMLDKSEGLGDIDEIFSEFANRYQGYDSSDQNQAHIGQIIRQNEPDLNIQIKRGESGFPHELVWQRNGGSSRSAKKRICPHCHCYLPADIEDMDSKNIVLLGSTSCGKTTLIAGMLYMLIGDLSEAKPSPHVSRRLGSVSIEADSLSFARMMMNSSLLDAKRDPTEVDKPIFPIVLVVRDNIGNHKTLVTIHDFAGEGLAEEEYFANHPISAANHTTDGILYAIDSCQLPELANYNIAHACTEDINAALLNFSNSQRSVLSRADALAVVLTKFDVYMRFAGQGKGGHVYEPLMQSHSNGVNINTIKDVSNAVKRILDPQPDNHIVRAQIENLFQRHTHGKPALEDVEYFATACLKSTGGNGVDSESTAIFDKTCLHRVCEPLLYMFAKWGIFTAE